MLNLTLALVVLAPAADPLPDVVVERDNVVITESCRLIVPKGMVISDDDGNGVVQIGADGITVLMDEASGVLRGSAPGTPAEAVSGVAVRVENRENVTLRGLVVEGYKGGIVATGSDGLTIDGGSFSHGYAMRLKSTAEAEHTDDWLWPHHNDEGEWFQRYGGQIVVERSAVVTIRGVKVRSSQNGILLSSVRGAEVYDNDTSYLSGWGIALWRSRENLISRNAADFCIRGYSHGKYNRGQDSAGILLFEQCSDNLIVENSATHCGDGLFVFAGREAMGEVGPASMPREGAGCNNNLILNNDFSHAAAHGVEVTFSFGNVIAGNRLVGNAICGIWGGYSQNTVIAANTIEGNGQPGLGEGGGINIEHGAGNVIRENTFKGNSVGVALWTDADEALRATPWAKANYRGSVENLIAKNTFEDDGVAITLRDTGSTAVAANTFIGVDAEIEANSGAEPDETMVTMDVYAMPEHDALGETRPVGARGARGGRAAIIMGEYFPWDQESVIFRTISNTGSTHVFHVYGASDKLWAMIRSPLASVRWTPPEGEGDPTVFEVNGPAGVHAYALRIAEGDRLDKWIEGTLVKARWRMSVFPSAVDPREDLDGWRALEEGEDAKTARRSDLHLEFGAGGPSDLDLSGAVIRAKFEPNHFGIIARATTPMTPGRWRVRTVSDDGIRVVVDGATVIEDWTHHAAKEHVGEFVVEAEREVSFVVEYFELDGAAVLKLELERAPDAS